MDFVFSGPRIQVCNLSCTLSVLLSRALSPCFFTFLFLLQYTRICMHNMRQLSSFIHIDFPSRLQRHRITTSRCYANTARLQHRSTVPCSALFPLPFRAPALAIPPFPACPAVTNNTHNSVETLTSAIYQRQGPEEILGQRVFRRLLYSSTSCKHFHLAPLLRQAPLELCTFMLLLSQLLGKRLQLPLPIYACMYEHQHPQVHPRGTGACFVSQASCLTLLPSFAMHPTRSSLD